MKIPFSPPYIDDSVEEEVLDTLRSGWITTGPKVKALEGEISQLAKVERTLCVNSATSGMMLALHWFGVGKGDEVIIPAYTYVATALVVQHLGATPVLVDIDEDFNISPERLNAAITEKTKAVIPVDFGGWPCDYDRIYEVINAHQKSFVPSSDIQTQLGRILVMADAAHSIGASYKGKPSGSLADISVFSLHAVKNVTSAEGGAICINMPAGFSSDDIYDLLRLWTLNGQTKDAFTKSKGGSWRYDIVYPGFKINMPDICAAIALAQIRQYQQTLLPERRRVFNTYVKLFQTEPWAILPPMNVSNTESSYHLFALRLSPEKQVLRDKIIDHAAQNGAALNVHFIPLPELRIFKERGCQITDFPEAGKHFNQVITLPIYPQLTDEECEYIFSVIKEAIDLYS